MQKTYFEYGQTQINYLKERDAKLAKVIDKVGKIEREIITDLFSALVYSIIGQQISTKAHQTIWQRLIARLGVVNSANILKIPAEDLQSLGLSWRKVEYIKGIAHQVANANLDLENLHKLNYEEVCAQLVKLKGVGRWTAEMIMLFSMQRPNILSYDDLAIRRALQRLYNHREITPKLHKKYWRLYSPYASVASLYLWALASGELDYIIF